MADLNAIFNNAAPIIKETLESSGTTIALVTGEQGTDPDTLEPTGDEPTTGDALAVYLTEYSLVEGQPLPGVELILGDWKILAAPGFDPDERQKVTCLTSREAHFVGQTARVLGVKHGGHAMMVTIYARPIAPGG